MPYHSVPDADENVLVDKDGSLWSTSDIISEKARHEVYVVAPIFEISDPAHVSVLSYA